MLDIRVLQSISSVTSKCGDEVEALLAAPLRHAGKTLLPIGARVTGVIGDVHQVGLGLVRETATVEVNFNEIILPDGNKIALHSRVIEVDNARETVDSKGRIRGIRSTGTLGHRASSFVASFAALDPVALAFTIAAMSSLYRFAEPEIYLPAGAEFRVRLQSPIAVAEDFSSTMPAVAATRAEREELLALLRRIPFRTTSGKLNSPSDLTNVLFVGRRVSLERAFDAAGWTHADTLSAGTIYTSMRSLAESQGYRAAPMTPLLLEQRKAEYSYAKTLNTFVKRHHIRIWRRDERLDGEAVWAAASTQDVGVTFRGHTHLIDPQIDNERAKVVNDLILTGCVDGLDLIGRPWVPRDLQNSDRRKLATDGAIAVVRINDCNAAAHPQVVSAMRPANLNGTQRVIRQGLLTFKNDVVRGNVVWRGWEGVHYAVRHIRPVASEENAARDIEIEMDAVPAMRSSFVRPVHTQIEEEPERLNDLALAARPTSQPAPRNESRWAPPLVELALSGGTLNFGSSIGSIGLSFTPKKSNTATGARTFDHLLDPGWSFAPTVTLNTHRMYSHEFGFAYQSGTFHAQAADPLPPVTGSGSTAAQRSSPRVITQQFSYSFLAHMRTRNSRLRPYAAIGPVFQTIRLTGSNMKATGVFRFGLGDIGIVRAAYDFGKNAPFDGGGIFQAGVQYGGGIRYRVAPRWTLRCDMRQTVSPQPQFWSKASAAATSDIGDGTLRVTPGVTGRFHQARMTAGFAFTF